MHAEPSQPPSVSIHLLEPAPSVCVTDLQGAGSRFVYDKDEKLIKSSLWFNLLLLVGKAYLTVLSSSPAIFASLVDSSVDVLIQAALFWASLAARRGATSPQFPVGRSQLEPVSVVVCAALKVAGMVAVLCEAASDLHDGRRHVRKGLRGPHPWLTIVVLGSICVGKFAFCLWCELVVRGDRRPRTETVRAVLADNQNDVLLGAGALVATVVAQSTRLWWADPGMAIALALYITARWMRTGKNQVEMIVGRAADANFLETVRDIAETHDPLTSLDSVRAYHFGPRFLVEVEVVMDEGTALRDSHDAGILLQHKIEALPAVERCFVHIDYQHRAEDDHDMQTPVTQKMHAARCTSPSDGGTNLTARLLSDLDTVQSPLI